MKRHHRTSWLSPLILLLVGALALGQAALAQDLGRADVPDGLALAHFGQTGDRVPELAREFLPRDFFTMQMTEPLANRKNFTAIWSIPKTLGAQALSLGAEATSTLVEQPIRHFEARLVLGNDGDVRNDLTLSATTHGGREVRNFLVGVEPGEQMVLDISTLKDFEALYLLSLQDFSASVEVRADGKRIHRDLEVMTPVRRAAPVDAKGSFDKSGSIYCAEIQRSIQICLSGTCVTGYADRYDRGYTWPDGDPVYYVDVDYPSQGDAFHVGGGAGVVSTDPECKQYRYYTHRTDNSKTHYWNGLDNTLFSCQSSTAVCNTGCTDTFQIDC